jgi:hypothetical protein
MLTDYEHIVKCFFQETPQEILSRAKGEQPISDLDLSLAEMMSTPTDAAVQRNE